MAYEKKIWANKEDIPENELSQYPRFDAENMNRIEDGVSEAISRASEMLPLEGGTINGKLTVNSILEVLSRIYAHQNGSGVYLVPIAVNGKDIGFQLQAVDETSGSVKFYIAVSEGKISFVNQETGQVSYIYGEHNKPKPADIGAVQERLVNTTNDKINFVYGDHRRLTDIVDSTVPNVPKESNFLHMYTTRNNVVQTCLSMPYDYSTDMYYYTVRDKVWRKVADASKFLSLDGGTLIGHSIFLKNGYARLGGGDGYIQLDAFNSTETQANRRKLTINSSMAAADLKEAITLTDTINNTGYGYIVFGEHNKPTGTYIGGKAQTIPIGGTGSILMITSSNRDIAFVEAGGARVMTIASNAFANWAPSYVTFNNGVLTLDSSSTTMEGLNKEGRTYYYQLL